MTDAPGLLARHSPTLRYDALEAYFADSAAIFTDAPSIVLARADGSVLARTRPKAREAELSLAYLGPHVYADGRSVRSSDALGDTTREYAAHAAAMHRRPGYADRLYGHARRDREGRLWLQYWLFSYYNDFRLLGPLVGGGKHEGDWECVQVRLNAGEQPEQVVYSQHGRGESRAWQDAPRDGARPLVFVARGSHANYFSPGSHWTGVWWDQADGRGRRVTPALDVLSDPPPGWVVWPGRWGDTQAQSLLDSSSPPGPGGHAAWTDPTLLGTVWAAPVAHAAPPPPPAPSVHARRDGGKVVIRYEAGRAPGVLVVGLRPLGSDAPAAITAVPAPQAAGEVELPIGDGEYEVLVSASPPDGSPSPAAITPCCASPPRSR